MFDLISALELAGSAVVVIGGLAAIFGVGVRERALIAIVLTTWFVGVVFAGATRALYYDGGLGVPGLGIAVVLPILVLSLISFATPYGRDRLSQASVPALLAIQAVRVLGISFVLLYALHRLPAPFAPVAGWGDIAVGAAAIPVAWLVSQGTPGNHRIAFLFSIFGLLDLVAAVGLGATSSPGPIRLFEGEPSSAIMTLLPWIIIPCFLVPTLSFVHLATFYRLLRDRREGQGAPHATPLG